MIHPNKKPRIFELFKCQIFRNTVKRYCLGDVLPCEKRPRMERQKKVITEEVKEFANQCFELDKNAPKKQRHTAKRIYERLKQEKGFQGAESTIWRLVSQLRPRDPEVSFVCRMIMMHDLSLSILNWTK